MQPAPSPPIKRGNILPLSDARDEQLRIGVVLTHRSSDAVVNVAMEPIDIPTADHLRRWKLPQGQVLNPHRPFPGQNGLNLLTSRYGLNEDEVNLREVWPDWITEHLPPAEAARKGFKSTLTKWTFFSLAHNAQPVSAIAYKWVPLGDVTSHCQAFRQETYSLILDMVQVTLNATASVQ